MQIEPERRSARTTDGRVVEAVSAGAPLARAAAMVHAAWGPVVARAAAMVRSARGPLVAGATVLAAACGSTAAPPAARTLSAAALAPCALLTLAEAQQAVGRSLEPGHPEKQLNDPSVGNSCTWVASGGQPGSLALMFFGFPSAQAADTHYTELEQARSGVQTVSGIGQEAFYLAAGTSGGSFIFRTGSTLGELVLASGASSDPAGALRAAAGHVLSRL